MDEDVQEQLRARRYPEAFEHLLDRYQRESLPPSDLNTEG